MNDQQLWGMTAGLFEEPLDVETIAPLIAGISSRSIEFLKIAIICCGTQARWEATLDQVARLVTAYEAAGEDDTDLYRLLACLGLRAGQLRERIACRALFGRRYPHLEIDRINHVAMQIIRTRPGWYPLPLPPMPEQAEHARKFWSRL